jgi:hypothetical protein
MKDLEPNVDSRSNLGLREELDGGTRADGTNGSVVLHWPNEQRGVEPPRSVGPDRLSYRDHSAGLTLFMFCETLFALLLVLSVDALVLWGIWRAALMIWRFL